MRRIPRGTLAALAWQISETLVVIRDLFHEGFIIQNMRKYWYLYEKRSSELVTILHTSRPKLSWRVQMYGLVASLKWNYSKKSIHQISILKYKSYLNHFRNRSHSTWVCRLVDFFPHVSIIFGVCEYENMWAMGMEKELYLTEYCGM